MVKILGGGGGQKILWPSNSNFLGGPWPPWPPGSTTPGAAQEPRKIVCFNLCGDTIDRLITLIDSLDYLLMDKPRM